MRIIFLSYDPWIQPTKTRLITVQSIIDINRLIEDHKVTLISIIFFVRINFFPR